MFLKNNFFKTRPDVSLLEILQAVYALYNINTHSIYDAKLVPLETNAFRSLGIYTDTCKCHCNMR